MKGDKVSSCTCWTDDPHHAMERCACDCHGTPLTPGALGGPDDLFDPIPLGSKVCQHGHVVRLVLASGILKITPCPTGELACVEKWIVPMTPFRPRQDIAIVHCRGCRCFE